MYAVIKSGGKQYRVNTGDMLKLEKLPVEIGGEINFTEILMVHDDHNLILGTPIVSGMAVKAEVIEHGRHKKIMVIMNH